MESAACRGLGRVSIASIIMGAPACTTAVGLAVGAIAGAGETDWASDACGREVGAALWLVADGGLFADLGEAIGAGLAGCGIDAGMAL